METRTTFGPTTSCEARGVDRSNDSRGHSNGSTPSRTKADERPPCLPCPSRNNDAWGRSGACLTTQPATSHDQQIRDVMAPSDAHVPTIVLMALTKEPWFYQGFSLQTRSSITCDWPLKARVCLDNIQSITCKVMSLESRLLHFTA